MDNRKARRVTLGNFFVDVVAAVIMFFTAIFLLIGSAYPRANIAENDMLYIFDSLEKEEYQISGLTGKSLFQFNLNPEQGLLIMIQQQAVDVRLTIYDVKKNSTTLVNVVDTPDDYRRAEMLFVGGNDCEKCLLEVTASPGTTTKIQYQLDIISIKNADSSEVKAYTAFSTAGRYWSCFSTEQKQPCELLQGDDVPSPSEFILEAHSEYVKSEKLARRANNANLMKESIYQQSVALHFAGQFEAQAETLIKLKAILSHEDPLYARVLLDLASHSVFEDHNYEAANSYLNQIFMRSDLHLSPFEFLDSKELLAVVQVRQGLFQTAIKTYEETSDRYMELGDYFSATNSLVSLGFFYYQIGDLITANKHYYKALSLAQSTNDHYIISYANIRLASVFRNLGELQKANEHLLRSEELSSEFKHSYLGAWTKQEKALLLKTTSQYLFAQDMLADAKLAATNLGQTNVLINLEIEQASVNLQLGNTAKSKSILENLIADYENSSPWLIGRAKQLLAETLYQEGNVKSAIKIQIQAVELFSRTENKILSTQADAFLQVLKAHKYPLDSVVLKAFKETMLELENIGLLIPSIVYRYKYAKAVLQEHPTVALDLAKVAYQKLKNSYYNIHKVDLKKGYLAAFQDLNSLIISLDEDLTPKSSLLLAESVRAQSLEAYTSSNEKKASYAETAEFSRLLQMLSTSFIELSSSINEVDRREALRKARKASDKIYEFESIRYDRKGDNLLNGNDKGKHEFGDEELKDLQLSLKDDEAILFVDTARFKSHVWLILNNKIFHQEAPDIHKIATETQKFKDSILKKHKGVGTSKSAIWLANMLLNREMSDKLKYVTSLYIVPDGPLTKIPFSLLPLINSATDNEFLTAISYQPSLAYFGEQKSHKNDRQNLNNILVVSNPEMKHFDNLRFDKDRFGFISTELPYSKIEEEKIGLIASSRNYKSLTRANANKEKLLDTELVEYDVIHFAVHGVVNNDVSEMSGLVLSNAINNDNLLLSPQIKSLKLEAEVVVLSGCDTLTGKYVEGEGLLGLSRAFMQSGARSVIASLWKVQDKATSMLMSKFYQNLLEKNMDKRSALSDAQYQLRTFELANGRKPWSAPYYWAGFVLHGY